MRGKIAFEEHLAVEETVGNAKAFAGDSGRWDDFTWNFLTSMKNGWRSWTRPVLKWRCCRSTPPACRQSGDTDEAIELARKANAKIAGAVTRHPDRYVGMAALPMQDPAAASAELERCVKELGFKGAMVTDYPEGRSGLGNLL